MSCKGVPIGFQGIWVDSSRQLNPQMHDQTTTHSSLLKLALLFPMENSPDPSCVLYSYEISLLPSPAQVAHSVPGLGTPKI